MAIAQKTVKDLPPRLQECHERAMQALQGGRPHVAAELLFSLLLEEPGCVSARKVACEARLAATGGPPEGLARWLAAARLLWPLRRSGPALLRAGRVEPALRLADQLLRIDPSSREVLLFAARCLDAARAGRSAADLIEIAVSLYPEDPLCWRALADQCAKAAVPLRAAEAYKRLAELCPGDAAVRDALRRATVAAAQARARETAAPVPASEAGPAAPAPAGAPSVSAPEPGLSLAEQIARAEVSLGQEPSLRACRDLARLYLTAQRFSDAIRTLRQAVERPDFDDSGLADDLTVAYRGQADAAVATWKQCAREHPDRAAEAEREASAAIQERDRLLLELQRGQAARHPRDSRRRLELAEMLLARGEWSEALEHFAAARNHPNLKWRALAGMGRCQLNQGVAAEAVVSLRQALDAGVTGPLRDRLAVMYDLAIACERTGRVEEANALLKDIFAQDRTFKDVGERIRRLAETPVPPAAPRRQ